MARRALDIFESAPTRVEALLRIQVEFDVSNPTARNLIGRGQFLRQREGAAMKITGRMPG
jgi:hypothetical protein